MAVRRAAGAGGGRWVALLRGVNLGARNKLAMADLRALVEALPAQEVATYVQSGNVVFRPQGAGPDEAAERIAAALREELGLEVPVLVRRAEELARLVAGNPFLAAGRDAGALHVTFLAEAPAGERLRALQEASFAPDEVAVAARDLYLHTPKGYGRSRVGNAVIERRLGVPATTRNWRTVTKLAELAGAASS